MSPIPSRRAVVPSRRQFLQRSVAAGLVLGGGGLVTGCGDDDAGTASSGSNAGGDSGTSTTAALQELSIMMPSQVALNYVADLAGSSGGYMEEHGVDLDVQFAQQAPQTSQQLAAGNVQIIRNAPVAVAKAVAGEGAPFIAFAMPVQQLIYLLVSTPDDPVDSLDQLEGRTVGIPTLGSHAEDTFRLLMSTEGLDPDAVTLEAVGNEPTSYAIMEEGRVDALMATRETTALMEANDMGPHVAEIESSNPLMGIALVTTNDVVESERDALVGYLRGLADSMRAVQDRQSRDDLLATIGDDWGLSQLKQPTEVDQAVLDTIAGMWFAEGEENLLRNIPEHWEQGVEAFKRLQIIPADARAEDFYTNDLWDEAFA
jgi:NitT/TauT family transport system substrate-binding protein